jgi:oligoendopeptidase F
VKNAKTKKKSTAALPVWDLSHLVAAPAEAALAKGLKKIARDAEAFRQSYEGKMGGLSPTAFGKAITAYEKIGAELGRFYSYASLDRQTKLNDENAGKLLQTVMEQGNDITSSLLFFHLEINKIPDTTFKKKLQDKTSLRYKPYLDALRALRPYQLPDAVEKAVHERGVTGHPAWVRLFDETSARLRFPIGGKMLTATEAFHIMTASHDGKARKTAAKAIEKILGENAQTFGLILNTIAKEHAINDRQRGFKDPVSSRNIENQVDDDVVEALVSAVRDSYPQLSHRYYKLKAKWMGVKKLDHWDRNAPLPFASKKKVPWEAAKMQVLSAYRSFHPQMAEIAERFFNEGWIDARPGPGKDSGAFSAATVPQVHPYILLNYKGEVDDVMTLAHELGHGIHQVLSSRQGYLMADTPLTVAETASVFGEMLTFQSFLKQEKDPLLQKAVIAGKVEDMLNTVVRQIAFHSFEAAVHRERRTGELTPERICALWMQTMQESLGPVFRLDDGYKYFWSYISHFYHVPFYVYSYAFGDCLVNALYAVYERAPAGFAEKYLELLKAGGTKRPDALLKPFGLNARDPAFWKDGLSVISGLIDRLEE